MPTFNFVTDLGAPTDGVTSCDTAIGLWINNAIANDGSTLIIPAYNGIGVPSPYNCPGGGAFGNGVTNCTISAQSGASVNNLALGNVGGMLMSGFNQTARIQTANPGDTSVQCIVPSQSSRFTVGNWMLVTGLGIQSGPSGPPNFQYYEYRKITNISGGGAISFTDPLTYTYLSSWPLVDPNQLQSGDEAGPATIYPLTAQFDGTQTYSGLKCTFAGGVTVEAGKSMILTNMDFSAGNGPSCSLGKSMVLQNCQIGAQNEVDKILEYLEYNNCTGGQLLIASACPTRLVVKNGSILDTMNGTAINTEIRDTSVISTSLFYGCLGFGHSNSLIIDGSVSLPPLVSIGNGTRPAPRVLNLPLTLSNGVFSISNSVSLFDWVRFWVPGHCYIWGYNPGDGSVHITDDSGKQHPFRVFSTTQDASNIYVTTDATGVPAVTFSGNATNTVFGYMLPYGGLSPGPLPNMVAQPTALEPAFGVGVLENVFELTTVW